MSGLHEVDCSGCGRRHVTSGEQARKLRVLRCECGHFVRLDRAHTDRRSEPTPPPIEIPSARDEPEEDDATRMMSTLVAAALVNASGRSRSQQPSLVDDERVSRPAPRDSTQAPAPVRARQPSIAPTEKPLWYVDLGGTELVEMTIEQLIIARRTGKLGEGALVWREGMPTWRPVGTLIPAASASSHPAPLAPSTAPGPTTSSVVTRPPAPAIRTPLPGRSPPKSAPPAAKPTLEEATPQSLASYERPLATLEFALEKPEPTPLLAPTRAPFPSLDTSAHPSTRPPPPLARASFASLSSLSNPLSTPFPRPAQLPRVAAPATPSAATRPSPPPPPVAITASSPPTSSPIPVVTAVRSTDRPSEHALANLHVADSLSERPRWLSACIALVVCVTASAAGASLVRSLKQSRPAQVLPASAAATPRINTPASSPAAQLPAPTASSAPRVVELESLSVERKRSAPRSVRATPKLVPTETAESSEETPPQAPVSAPESSAPETPNSSDLPPAARSNPYGSGSLIDQIKKATADEEAGQ